MDKSPAVGNVGNVGKSPNLGGSSMPKAIGETRLLDEEEENKKRKLIEVAITEPHYHLATGKSSKNRGKLYRCRKNKLTI